VKVGLGIRKERVAEREWFFMRKAGVLEAQYTKRPNNGLSPRKIGVKEGLVLLDLAMPLKTTGQNAFYRSLNNFLREHYPQR